MEARRKDCSDKNLNKCLDFKKYGRFIGFFNYAEIYIDKIRAIKPKNESLPFYEVLDRLEKVDQEFIDRNSLPGYYHVVDADASYHHEFDLIKFNDAYTNIDSPAILLSKYHGEFAWKLHKIAPREKVINYLDYHLSRFSKEKEDFLNHVQYRLLEIIENFTRSYYPIYEDLINNWIKNQKKELSRKGEEYLVNSFLSAVDSFLDGIHENRKLNDENKYNSVIRDYLNHRFSGIGWHVKDQSLGGESDSRSSASRAGIALRDLIVINKDGRHISNVECFRINSVPNSGDVSSEEKIKNHLIKIFRNDPLGVSPLIVIVYCETRSFNSTWQKYLGYIERMSFEKYPLEQIKKDNTFSVNLIRANVRIAIAIHNREDFKINVYHIFVNMNP